MTPIRNGLVLAASCTLSFPVLADANSYFGASYSSRQNDVITVLADTEVEYENSAYIRYEFSQKLYKDLRLGAVLQMDEEAKDVIGYAGQITKNRWFVSVERSEFDGVMTDGSGNVFETFEGNKYLDIKLLKKSEGGDSVEDMLSLGVQYLSYQRPAAFEQESIEYYDTSLENRFLAFVFELDGVKEKMLSGKIEKTFDWYFYNTTALGIGQLESTAPMLRSAPGTEAEPEQTTWTGFGIAGEYELGMVYYMKMPWFRLAAKAGYRVDLEGPVMFHEGSFDDLDTTVHPDEQLLNHGPNVSLAVAF
ncbi:MAG: hypothetical protein CMI00_09805 [Oceanospirillaceae bacterium]|nr:hypothetical protein [Oceanospirillaceae bacterium]|tara:strand:+ start:145 stop:1062 length:918 start_codon:yes stop_codon:yes gene_type:complete